VANVALRAGPLAVQTSIGYLDLAMSIFTRAFDKLGGYADLTARCPGGQRTNVRLA
jgi:hypothetical protein